MGGYPRAEAFLIGESLRKGDVCSIALTSGREFLISKNRKTYNNKNEKQSLDQFSDIQLQPP